MESKEIQEKRRERLDLDDMDRDLEARLAKVMAEYERALKENELVKRTMTDDHNALNDVKENLKTEIEKANKLKFQLEHKLSEKNNELQILEEKYNGETEKQRAEFATEIAKMKDDYKTLETRFLSIEHLEKDKKTLLEDIASLREALDEERKEKVRDLADKDREKVQATDKLQKEMRNKIEETTLNLKQLKKEQLQTTTRLTVLQNHQLTTELEYQSRQTEKLLEKNNKYQEEVATLKRDIEIHKQVEDELAKKAQSSQKIIKKLNDRVKELDDEVAKYEQEIEANNENRRREDEGAPEEKKQEEMIQFLESNINFAEKKYAKLKNDYDIMKFENEELRQHVDENKRFSLSNIPAMLNETMEGLLGNGSSASILDSISASHEEMRTLRGLQGRDFDSWGYEEKKLVMKVLINRIRPYISKHTLNLEEQDMNPQAIQEKNMQITEEDEFTLPEIPNKFSYAVGGIPISDLINKKQKFKNLPLEVGTSILKSDLREWGKKALTQQKKGAFSGLKTNKY